MIDGVGDLKILVLAGAARGEEASRGDGWIARQGFAGDVVNLAGVDVFGLEGRKNLIVESGAVNAGDRGVLDHRHLGARRAHGHVIGRGGRRGGLLAAAQGGGDGEDGDEGGEGAHGIYPRYLWLIESLKGAPR